MSRLPYRLSQILAAKVARCVIMGGAGDYVGNSSVVAEYNIWADPEAAKIVFESGMAITMVGWDVSLKYAVIDSGGCQPKFV